MTSRRAFVGGGISAVLSVGLWGCKTRKRVVAADYYADCLARVAARVRENAKTCDAGFWFMTDLHIGANCCQSGRVCADLIGRTDLDRVLCGGDLTEAFATRNPTDRAAIDFAIENFRDRWVNPIREAGGTLLCAKGNHDFTVRHAPGVNAGVTLSGREASAVIVGEWTSRDVVTNPADPTACYYFQDDDDADIRYIVVDTTDTETAGDVPWGVKYGVNETQLFWLAGTALGTLPKGYDVVFMHHIPVTGVVASESEVKTFANLRQLLEAFQNRGKIMVAKREFDFSKATGRILVDITGHHHAERQTFQNGILHVTEPCDTGYRDYIVGSAPWCGDLPLKKKGTVVEQTFDAVQFSRDRRLVRFTRVGGGQDRAIHLEPLTVKVGDTLKLDAGLLTGGVTFGCYDGDRIVFKPNPKSKYNPIVSYETKFAEISADGVLKAKRPGPVMALALDKDLNKEIFPVTVVA